jgi:hypothetical protein
MDEVGTIALSMTVDLCATMNPRKPTDGGPVPDGDRPRWRGTPNAQVARLFKVGPPMKGGRTVALAMTMALLLAVASPAMAGCQAKGAATTQEERTANRGATNPSAADGPQVVTTLMA